jgi:hypothetical protein
VPSHYAIVELDAGEAGSGFQPRGALWTLWNSRDFETIVAGPAETGKTWGCLQYVDALLWKYPGAQGVMARKTYNSLVGSALRTYQRILGPHTPVATFGGSKPQWFDYPNGSRLWLAGLDKPGKALSSERDFIYVNQAEELELEDWETLTTRATGRGSVMPYTRVFADCNPGPPSHWIKRRAGLRLLESRHEDNPTLFDDDGKITEQGKRTLSILDSLTGVRYQRLRKGLWVQAEGCIYDGYDPAVHLIDPFDVPQTWARYWTIDFGYTNPFVLQFWAADGDGRAYRYREIYKTQGLVEDHARNALRAVNALGENGKPDWRYAKEPKPRAVICDHDAEDRASFERHTGLQTVPAKKEISVGIQETASRLRVQADGKPRLFFFRDAVIDKDADLDDKRLPCSTTEEFEVYCWDVSNGRRKGEQPEDKNNHGMDGMRYLVRHLDGHLRVIHRHGAASGQPEAVTAPRSAYNASLPPVTHSPPTSGQQKAQQAYSAPPGLVPMTGRLRRGANGVMP